MRAPPTAFPRLALLLCLVFGGWTCSAENDEIVNPFDMLNYDRTTQSMKKATGHSFGHSSEPAASNEQCSVIVSRLINVLLRNTGLLSQDGHTQVVKSYASVKLSRQDLDSLKHMAASRDIDFTKVDEIFNSMFTHVKDSGFQEAHHFWGKNTHMIKDMLYWISIGFLLLSLLYISFKQVYFAFSISFVILIVFILGFASTWYTMYMKAVINRNVHLELMPINCDKGTGNWFSQLWWSNAQEIDECKKYKEAIYLDPKYSIAVTDVFSEMLSKMMTKPIESLGASIYGFNKSVFKDFPFWAQMIAVPMTIAIVIKSIFLAIGLLVGRSLSMKSVFGYGGTTIGQASTNNEQFSSHNRTNNNSTNPMASVPSTVTHAPQVLPSVNLNINNYFHKDPAVDSRQLNPNSASLSFNDGLKIDYNKEKNIIEMLKNKDNDSVDSKTHSRAISRRHRRHRTMSM